VEVLLLILDAVHNYGVLGHPLDTVPIGLHASCTPTGAAISAPPGMPLRDLTPSKMAKSAKHFVRSVSAKSWPARRRPAAAASAPLAPST